MLKQDMWIKLAEGSKEYVLLMEWSMMYHVRNFAFPFPGNDTKAVGIDDYTFGRCWLIWSIAFPLALNH